MELIEQAIANAVTAAGLRAAALKLADAAEFHAAVSRAYLRDLVGQQASEGKNPPAGPSKRRGRRSVARKGDGA